MSEAITTRERRRERRHLLWAAHPDTGGSTEQFLQVMARLGATPDDAGVRVWVHRRRTGPLGLLDDLRRALDRRLRRTSLR